AIEPSKRARPAEV
nr:Chain A, Deoxyuridine 5'-triphosphate nucleotidohydrolase, mitochondrial [Homo sapiens]4MZ6_C Chain C, Deoxyuridine 5'-triphosphate nucleotidohydrolase, mitochondrial [Homo sapiens]